MLAAQAIEKDKDGKDKDAAQLLLDMVEGINSKNFELRKIWMKTTMRKRKRK
jgi:hypothetical protein